MRRIIGRLAYSAVALAYAGSVSAQVVSMPDAATKRSSTPYKAVKAGVSGEATVDCRVRGDGVLTSCSVISESPTDHDIGLASIIFAQRFIRAKPPGDGGSERVQLPLKWNEERRKLSAAD